MPEFRHHHEDDRKDDDRVWQCEEANCALGKDQRRDRDERVGGVEITAEQEPGDHAAEPASAEAPLGENTKIPSTPASGEEADDSHKQEQDDEDSEFVAVNHRAPSVIRSMA